jgi:hypothetical protein
MYYEKAQTIGELQNLTIHFAFTNTLRFSTPVFTIMNLNRYAGNVSHASANEK